MDGKRGLANVWPLRSPREGRIIVDLVRGRRGNPAAITDEFCAILGNYRIKTVHGDRYAGEWVAQEFKRHGIQYLPAGKSRSELYLDLLPALTAGQVELPPCDLLSKQLVGLERRTSRMGRDLVDHAPNCHDDRANAAAGLVSMALKPIANPSMRRIGTSGMLEPTRGLQRDVGSLTDHPNATFWRF